MTKKLAAVFAVAAGLAVGNMYWAQPLLAQIALDFGEEVSRGGLLITSTQIGYAIGILLLVPLGDILRRRRLIPAAMLCCTAALAICAAAPSFVFLLAALLLVGLFTVSGQIIVPLTGDLADSSQRGHLVGIVVSGITIGTLAGAFGGIGLGKFQDRGLGSPALALIVWFVSRKTLAQMDADSGK